MFKKIDFHKSIDVTSRISTSKRNTAALYCASERQIQFKLYNPGKSNPRYVGYLRLFARRNLEGHIYQRLYVESKRERKREKMERACIVLILHSNEIPDDYQNFLEILILISFVVTYFISQLFL